MTPPNNDLLHRFIFDNTDIRGEVATLNNSLAELFARHSYPLFIQQLLGEFMVASAILSSTLKFEGLLTLQAQGNGPVPLILAEANHNRQLRSIAKLTDPETLSAADLPSLIGEGVMSITIDPDKGSRYQAIVPLAGPSLADCLELYFSQSEQLPTRLWLASDGATASGLLLQQMPQQLCDRDTNALAWENKIQLSNTITADELLHLDHAQLLTRLFHEEGVRCFEPQELSFGCSCSKIRSSRALQHLGQAEADEILQIRGIISVDCEFCGFEYTYDKNDIAAIFSPKTQH